MKMKGEFQSSSKIVVAQYLPVCLVQPQESENVLQQALLPGSLLMLPAFQLLCLESDLDTQTKTRPKLSRNRWPAVQQMNTPAATYKTAMV
jgi:hypothetical protein